MYKVTPSNHYSIWNSVQKEFQFGIQCEKPEQAEKGLFNKIRHSAKKYRFEVKKKTSELCKLHNQTQIKKMQNMIRQKKCEIEALEKRLLSMGRAGNEYF